MPESLISGTTCCLKLRNVRVVVLKDVCDNRMDCKVTQSDSEET